MRLPFDVHLPEPSNYTLRFTADPDESSLAVALKQAYQEGILMAGIIAEDGHGSNNASHRIMKYYRELKHE